MGSLSLGFELVDYFHLLVNIVEENDFLTRHSLEHTYNPNIGMRLTP